jgi:hypothetical protein
MRHSNTQTQFNTGAKRDTTEGKGRPSLISPVLIHRLGVLLQKGAEHYGEDNWSKGMPYRRTMDSVIRHAFQWLAGDEEEDHLAAIAFGVMCLMTFEERLADPKADSFLKSMDDRDKNLKKILASILTSPPANAKIETRELEPWTCEVCRCDVRFPLKMCQDCAACRTKDELERRAGLCAGDSDVRICRMGCGAKTVQPDGVCVVCKKRGQCSVHIDGKGNVYHGTR